MKILEPGRKNIVILGAGFGGVTALIKLYRALKKRGLMPYYNLVIVNKNDYHLYTPALYEMASMPRVRADAFHMKRALCVSLYDILPQCPGARFIGEEIEKIDPRTHLITFKSGDKLNFEYAVVALGAETSFFGIPGLEERSLPIKTFEDAVKLRNQGEKLLESAGNAPRVVVGGAGPTGVELSAEFVNLIRHLEKRATGPRGQVEITLIEASPEILPDFSPRVIRLAKKRLNKLGVKILTKTVIKKLTNTEVIIADNQSIPYQLFIWTGGITPNRATRNFGLALGKKGNIIVNEFLEARPRIYAIGDCVSLVNAEGQLLPKNVPVAEESAKLAAENIIADICAKNKHKFNPAAVYPFVLAVSGKYAITDLALVKFSGFIGWLLKQLIELKYLLAILPAAKAVRVWTRTVYYSSAND